MIPKDNRGISILDKLHISTKEVILYLESINAANAQIISVLKKKPALPGYEKLPWVIESKKDILITEKLRSRKKLNESERSRLIKMLSDAAKSLVKLRGVRRPLGLETYLKKLS